MPRTIRKPNLQLRQIVLEETNDGRDIVRYLKSVITVVDDAPDLFGLTHKNYTRTHKIAAARILARLGLEEGKRYLRRTAVPIPFRRTRPDDEPAPERELTRAELYRMVKEKTNDGREIMSYLVEIMKGYHSEFKAHHRMAAAKELVRQIEFEYEEIPDAPKPPSKPRFRPSASTPEITAAYLKQQAAAQAQAQSQAAPTANHPETQPTPTVIPAKAGIHPTQPAPSNISTTPAQLPPAIPAKAETQEEQGSGEENPSYLDQYPFHPPLKLTIQPIEIPTPDPNNPYIAYRNEHCQEEADSIFHSILRRSQTEPNPEAQRDKAKNLIAQFNRSLAEAENFTDEQREPVAVPDDLLERFLSRPDDYPFDSEIEELLDVRDHDFYFCLCRGCEQCDLYDYYFEQGIYADEDNFFAYEDP